MCFDVVVDDGYVFVVMDQVQNGDFKVGGFGDVGFVWFKEKLYVEFLLECFELCGQFFQWIVVVGEVDVVVKVDLIQFFK